MSQFFYLELDEEPVSVEFLYTKSNKTNQNGLKNFIPIDSLERGQNTLKLYYNFYNKTENSIYKRFQAKTEFYKTTPKNRR